MWTCQTRTSVASVVVAVSGHSVAAEAATAGRRSSGFDRPSAGPSGGGGFKPQTENPQAGIRGRQPDTSEFGGSKMFIPQGFQTMPSKANDYNFEDDDMPPPFKNKPNTSQADEDAPF